MRRFSSVLTLVAFSVLACAPSEEEIQEEFADFVASRKACSVDEDCVLAATGCPLGCGTAVAREHQSAVEQKARELIDDYESGGRACDYECVSLVAVCDAGRCQEEQQ